MEKIFANEVTDKGLISKIYKQLIQLNARKTTQSKSGEKDLNRHFSKEDIQMANEHGKMLNITHYQRNANQNHNRYHLTQVRMAIMKKSTNNKSRTGCEEKGMRLHCWWGMQIDTPTMEDGMEIP